MNQTSEIHHKDFNQSVESEAEEQRQGKRPEESRKMVLLPNSQLYKRMYKILPNGL